MYRHFPQAYFALSTEVRPNLPHVFFLFYLFLRILIGITIMLLSTENILIVAPRTSQTITSLEGQDERYNRPVPE
jgi:hypothetical protein